MVKCPICNKEMTFDENVWFCNENVNSDYSNYIHKIVVLCQCERRMIPEAKYNGNKFTFWKCPHCFNKR
jgi:hypothetical protein